MATKSADGAARNFPNLSDEGRKAVNEAFDAISTWRTEALSTSEKNSKQVIEKMAAAARALGWPEQIVEATRAQLQNVTKIQIETLDRMMDAWEEQIKSPNPMTASSGMLERLKSLPSFGAPGGWQDLQTTGMNPLELYMQFTQQWQKTWTDAMAFWAQGRKAG